MALAAAAVLVALGGSAMSQTRNALPGGWNQSKAQRNVTGARYQGMLLSSRYLTMRDGVKIAIDVLLPSGLAPGEKIPAILHQTRYWRSVSVPRPLRSFFPEIQDKEEKERFVTHGYAWVDVDVRGTGASFGSCPTPNFSIDQIRDGGEVVDWIVRQPWSNGVVGATGVSYGGTTAQLLLVNHHPAVRAVAVRFADFDEYADVAFPGGVYFRALVDTWAGFTSSLDRGALPESLPWWMRWGGKLIGAGVRPVDADRDRSMLAAAIREHAANFDGYAALAGVTYRDDDAGGLTIDDISAHRFAQAMQASRAAVYSYDGWFDAAYVHGAIKRYLSVRTPRSRLTLGPWAHGGVQNFSPFAAAASEPFDQVGELLRFFDYHLKGIDTGIEGEPPVHYFTMGEEKWKAAETWPPPGLQAVTYYLAARNLLAPNRPAGDGFDTYRTDSTVGTGSRTRWDGITGGFPVSHTYTDRRRTDERLLTYTSTPFEQDTEVTGHPIVTLYLSSTGIDGAVFAYLEDVDPDGRVFAVTEGQLRAVHRKLSAAAPYPDVVPYHSFKRADALPLIPGAVVELVFDLLPTSYLFRRGHSVRLALAGADRDHFATFPGTPTLQVYRSRQHASHIELPVMPRGRDGPARHYGVGPAARKGDESNFD